MKTALFPALLLAACSASSPVEPDLFPPTAFVVFPLRAGLTDAATITVTGRAEDDVDVVGVAVNGVAASSSDGFRTWKAVVPLALGENVIAIDVRDGVQTVTGADSVVVTRATPLWAAPATIAFAGSLAYVADGALDRIFTVDRGNGARTILSGAGPSLVSPSGMARDGSRLLVADAVLRAILAIDRSTGVRSVLAQGAPFGSPSGIAIDAARNRALVTDSILGSVLGVDLSTGDVTSAAAGFATPTGVAVDAAGGRAFVVDADGLHVVALDTGVATAVPADLPSARAVAFDPGRGRPLVVDGDRVVEVDPLTGDIVLLWSGFTFLRGIVVDPGSNEALLVDSVDDSVLRLDLATGIPSVLSRSQFGGGPRFENPRDVAVDFPRSRAFVIDFTVGLIEVDLSGTGLRDLIEGPGEPFQTPLGVDYDGIFNRVFVADSGLGALLEVFVAPGDRSILTGALTLPIDVTVDARNGLAYVADTGSGTLVRVDLGSGVTQTLLGVGPPLVIPRALTLADGRMLVVDDGLSALLEVDPLTGDRTLVSGALTSPSGVALYRGRALVTDTSLNAVLSIDLGSGDVVALAGSGPPLVSPQAIAVGVDFVLVIDSGLGALLAIEPASGDRIILSK